MGATYRTPSPLRDDNFLLRNMSPQSEQATRFETSRSSVDETREPSTPTKKRLQIGWHGLLSPQTPTFAGDASVDTSSQMGTHIIKTSNTGGLEKTAERNVQAPDHISTLNGDQHEAVVMFTAPDPIVTDGKVSQDEFTLNTAEKSESEVELHHEQPSDEFTTPLSASSVPDTVQVRYESAVPSAEPHEQDAFLSPSGLRRSTRIRTAVREKEASQAVMSAPKKTTKASVISISARTSTNVPSSTLVPKLAPNLTAAEPTASPFDVALSSADNLPVLHSSEWQLQYPPGGSTHPSYPWPSMDPRLVFQSHFVPLNNGLPDVSQMPPLALPMGWTHVSWAGLLPVAFDPYRQAFKLTPVGPMPLTCEELQQGGLHRYVPGGDLHPEFGMLPDVLALSDGSDAEVFNFEHVDWVLPWAALGGILTSQAHDGFVRLSIESGDSASPEETPQPQDLQTDERDCPDNIVDVEDAWRWLIEKDLNPSNVFVPTPAKTWKGTGIYRCSRKTKAPIPSLMALALADAVDNPEGYLSKQNGREFCPFKSIATPVHVDMTLLKDTEFTLVELLAYFPNHYAWRKGADRLALSGMTAGDITNTINMIRGLSGEASRKSATINDNVFFEKEAPGNSTKKARIVRPEDKPSTYTAKGWTYNTWETTDYPLLGLAHGLLGLPTGPDAGPITALIHWCRGNGRYRVMLSEVHDLLQEADIDPLIEPGEKGCPDKEVVGRYAEALKVDRVRVLKTMAAATATKKKKKKQKRQLESGEERKDKRTRVDKQ